MILAHFWSGSMSRSRVTLSIWKEKIINNYRENYFLSKKYRYRIFFKLRTIFTKKFYSELWIYILSLGASFSSIISYIYLCGSVFGIRILIKKTSEDGSNTDSDPQHWLLVVWVVWVDLCSGSCQCPSYQLPLCGRSRSGQFVIIVNKINV